MVARDLLEVLGHLLGREAFLPLLRASLGQADQVDPPLEPFSVEPVETPPKRLGAVRPGTARIGVLGDSNFDDRHQSDIRSMPRSAKNAKTAISPARATKPGHVSPQVTPPVTKPWRAISRTWVTGLISDTV